MSALTESAAFALDLASKRDGYLTEFSPVIDELRQQGLVTMRNIGDGFLIVRAIERPSRRRAANGQWGWTMDGARL